MTSEVWHIVVVDDSPDDCAEARRMLLKGSDRRYAFTEAATGAAGIRAVQQCAAAQHRCIVLDYNLPDMTVAAFLAAISGSDGTPDWPVVVFTGGDCAEASRSSLRAGAHDYVGKSWMTPQVLVRAVENAAERWAMARELRQQTAAAQASEQHFKALAQATFDIVYRMSADWSLMQPMNGRALFPSTDTPLAGWAWLSQNVPADEHARVRQAIGEAIAQKVLFSLEHRVLRPDGSIGWTSSRAVPILDAHGTVREWFGAASDITERKRAEAALRETERNYRALADASAEVPYRMSADWSTMLALDGRGLFAGSPIALAEWAWVEHYLPHDEQARVRHAIRDAIAGKTLFELEHRVLRADGSVGWVRSRAVPLLDENETLVTWFGAASDITERKCMELDLIAATATAEKANRAKTDFLSSMSHELRTPLHAILGLAQLMESGAPTPAQRQDLEEIIQSGWYLQDLISGLLDIGQVESGTLSSTQEPVSLAEVLAECRAIIQPMACKRGIGMTFPLFDLPGHARADRTRVKQVVINLLSNAVKYNKAQGAITVDCALMTRDVVRVSVRDTGEGLAPEQVAQLFQPFNRLGEEAGPQEGTGIGLMLSKHLTELMGGTIGVDSAVGVGSVFWFELNWIPAPLGELAENEWQRGPPHRG